jgi:hypothetical protein
MATKTKLFLAAAILLLVAGLVIELGPVNTESMPALHVALPLAAIFIGMFLVSRVFEHEDKVPAEDQQRALTEDHPGPKATPAGKL